MDNHQKIREEVAREYGIALYRRYREKEAAGIVGYEAAWWKRHRRAGNIPYVRDAGGSIGYFGYMLCDILILGKDAVKRRPDDRDDGSTSGAPTSPPPVDGPGVAAELIHEGGAT